MLSYLEEIKNDRLKETVKKQYDILDITYKYNFLGEYIKDSSDFFGSIYRNYLEKQKRRTFLVGKNFDTQYKCENVEKVLEKQKRFCFFTPSIFWHHRVRTKDQLIWITEITLDFDFQKDGSNREFSPQALAYILEKEFGYLPNAIWSTRTDGNFQANFLINPMTGTPQSIYYYESIVKRMAILTGADVSAVSAVNLYTIPKHGFWKFSDYIHDIADFSWVLEDEEIEKDLERKRKERVISFTEAQIISHESIQSLLNAEFPQYRNHAAFTIALLFYALGKSDDEALDFLNGEWFDRVNDGRIYSKKGRFKRKEVTSTVKSAFSGRYHGPSKEWIYLITGIEFPYNLYKSSYIKKEDGYQSANQVQLKILKWVEDHNKEKVKKDVLCKELDIPEKSFRRNLKDLKDKKFIDYVSKTGKNGGYIIEDKRVKGQAFKVEPDTKVNVANIVNYFEKNA